MKNKEKHIISVFLIYLFSTSFVSANTNDNAIKLVTKFGHYIGAWTRNPGDIEARDGLKLICNNGQNMRVADRLALEKCTTTDDNTILLGSYLRIFEDRHNEKIDYIIYNPKVENVATKYATDNTNIISVVADVEVKSASLNYMMKNVFYIKDNKICFIGDYAKLNCPIWLSDSVIEVDCEYHDINIVVKSESEWNVELNKNWNKDGERLNNWWCDWRVSKRNDSTLHIFMTHNLRTSTYSDSIILKTGECKKTIKITQYGYNLHKATINDCFLEKNKKGQYIIHVDFDAYNYEIKGDTKFFVSVYMHNYYKILWEKQTEYRMPSGKHVHKNLRVTIPAFFSNHLDYFKIESVEIGILDAYGNELEKKTINIVNK